MVELTRKKPNLPEMEVKAVRREQVTLTGPDAYADGNVVINAMAEIAPDVFYVNPDVRSLVRRSSAGFEVLEQPDPLQQAIQSNMTLGKMEEDDDAQFQFVAYYNYKKALLSDILNRREWPALRQLKRICRFPQYIDDFELFKTNDYQKHSQSFGESMFPVTPMTGEAARTFLLDLVGEFPFLHESDLANAIAMALTPLLLPAIRDQNDHACVPVFLVDASTQGTGKTILLQTLMTPNLGLTAVPPNDQEFQKVLGAIAGDKREVLFLDNVADGNTFGYPTLAALTTQAGRAEMRRLGVNQMINGRFSGMVLLTGNNIQLDLDGRRRTVLIQLQAKEERPEERSGFALDLPEYAIQNRDKVHSALIGLVEHWKASGRPKSKAGMGSNFRDWSGVVGGVLDVCKIPGFLGNTGRLAERTDDGGWREFTMALGDEFQGLHATPDPFTNEVYVVLDKHYGNSLGKIVDWCEKNDFELPTNVARGAGASRSLGKAVKPFITGRKNFGGYMWVQTGSEQSKRAKYKVERWSEQSKEDSQ
jgi:hypothetical protein